MEALRHGTSSILIDKVADWLMQMALEETDLESVVRGCCERLAATGLPLVRAQFSFSILHPLYRAMGFTWLRGEGLKIEGYRHREAELEERFLKSPYYHLLSNNLEHLRRRLDGKECTEFPILKDFCERGYTDYLAFVNEFQANTGKGMLGSWATDQKGGFSENDLAHLLRIQNRLAVAAKMAMQSKLALSMLTTYLGAGAGSRVLEGQIRRGDGETTRAAIVMADIRNSTAMAENLGRQAYIDALNEFFDHVAGTFADAGGEILGFFGDGFLAVFPCERQKAESRNATKQAYQAAEQACQRMRAVNAQRVKSGDDEIGFGIGLHIGNVMFGNVGLEDRLTFSVFGSAVNEAARLESLTKKFGTQIVASQDFVDYCGGKWLKAGDEVLRGSSQEISIFQPDPDNSCKIVELQPRQKHTGLTDAENVVLLHRDAAS